MIEQVEQQIIRPEILAAKMAAVGNFKAPKVREQHKAHPRLFELLWFIQAMSMRPGGLVKFCESFLAEFSSRIGTATMRTAPKGKAPYGQTERAAIMREIPRSGWDQSVEKQAWLDQMFWDEADPGHRFVRNGPSEEQEKRGKAFVSKLTRQYFSDLCRDYALLHLPGHLARVCHEPESPLENVWYFYDLMGALSEMLDIHARRESASLAMTEVSLKIFDAMEYAHQERGLVHIEGDSRFGKSQSVKTWCAAWPGRARLVTVPCSNSDADLVREFAGALGMDFSFKTPYREIKATVQFIIQFGGLMFVADEAHWILPTRFTANTPPMRLNWLRSFVVDKDCPLVTVSTPQDYKQCLAKFTKATGHNIQQWLGRKMLNVTLPNELEESDLMAVARIHFPDLDEDFLQVIVGTALRSESYLMAVEAIARRVRYIARRDGHSSVTLADLKLAISEIIPAPPSPPKAAQVQVQEQRPLAVRVRPLRSTRPARPTAALEAPARSTTPTLQPV